MNDSGREGVAIRDVRRDSPLGRIGALPGDMIRQIDEINISKPDDLEYALSRYRQKSSLVILLQRGARAYYVTIRIR